MVPDNSRPILESNETIAQCLNEVADLLEGKGINPFRVKAYRTAAETVRSLQRPVSEVLRVSGIQGLIELPGIGESLATSIEKLSQTGELPLLSRLRGRSGSEAVLKTVPGIGPKTAHRIHLELGIESLGDLEAAAHDGRLAAMPGMGRKRIRAVCDSLAGRLGLRTRPAIRTLEVQPTDPPSVEELFSLDSEYRKKGKAGRLLQIAPVRFNPEGQAGCQSCMPDVASGGIQCCSPILPTPMRRERSETGWSCIAKIKEPAVNGRWSPTSADRYMAGELFADARLNAWLIIRSWKRMPQPCFSQ
jgi:Holliday junction resolvasome RuvABC DNA-binding subunit